MQVFCCFCKREVVERPMPLQDIPLKYSRETAYVCYLWLSEPLQGNRETLYYIFTYSVKV